MSRNLHTILLLIIFINLLTISVEAKKRKGGPGGMGGMGGGPFGNKKSQMIFITIRDGYIIPEGIDKMAKDFQ